MEHNLTEIETPLENKPQEAAGEPEQWPNSIPRAAVALGVGSASLSLWLAKGAPPKTDQGYDLAAIRAWVEANPSRPVGRPKKEGGKAGDQARLLKAQADEREEKAKQAALDYKVSLERFIPVEEVEERDIARISVVKRGLMSFARALPPKLIGLHEKDMQVVINKEVRNLLIRFSRM